MLSQTPQVTGIVCMNDLVAISVLHELSSSGRQVPRDFSVTGCDDLFFAGIVSPPLTTVRLNKYDMGRRAVMDLVGYIQGGVIAGEKFDSGIDLIERMSTAAPRQGSIIG